jgi:hypothetical protein
MAPNTQQTIKSSRSTARPRLSHVEDSHSILEIRISPIPPRKHLGTRDLSTIVQPNTWLRTFRAVTGDFR